MFFKTLFQSHKSAKGFSEERNRQISQKAMQRNHNILKNLTKMRFKSQLDRKTKSLTIEQKLAQAEARRHEIIQQKVDKAKKLYQTGLAVQEANTSDITEAESVQSLSLNKYQEEEGMSLEEVKLRNEKLTDKMKKADLRRTLMNQNKAHKARAFYTKFGPTLQQIEQIKKKRVASQLQRLKYPVLNQEQKESVAWRIDTESFKSQRSEQPKSEYVFVQEEKSNIKNMTFKGKSVAFELSRD